MDIKKTIFTKSATDKNIIPDYKQSLHKSSNNSWVLDLTGPQRELDSYSNIFLKEEYKLVGYSFSDSMGGNGYVYAIPKHSNLGVPKEYGFQKDIFSNPPKPKDSLSSFMMAIDGDRGPLSYLQAALIYHELCEYGAVWHGVNWGQDIILPIYGSHNELNDYRWNMLVEEPKTIKPHFYYDENNMPIVVFYTINNIGTVKLIEYKHVFDQESYILKVTEKLIAEAGIGIIF